MKLQNMFKFTKNKEDSENESTSKLTEFESIKKNLNSIRKHNFSSLEKIVKKKCNYPYKESIGKMPAWYTKEFGPPKLSLYDFGYSYGAKDELDPQINFSFILKTTDIFASVWYTDKDIYESIEKRIKNDSFYVHSGTNKSQARFLNDLHKIVEERQLILRNTDVKWVHGESSSENDKIQKYVLAEYTLQPKAIPYMFEKQKIDSEKMGQGYYGMLNDFENVLKRNLAIIKYNLEYKEV